MKINQAIILNENSKDNCIYAANFYAERIVYLETHNSKNLFVSILEKEVAIEKVNDNIKIRLLDADIWDKVNDILSKENIDTLLVEEEYLTVSNLKLLNDKVNGVKIIDSNQYFSNKRLIKTEKEISIMKEGFKIANELYDHVKNLNWKGKTENDIYKEMKLWCLNNDVSDFSFNPIIATGSNSSRPHAGHTNKIIESGDVITLDFGIVHNNYCTDMTRCLYVEKISDSELEIYNHVRKAHDIGISMIKTGVNGKDIDIEIRNYFKRYDLDKYFIHTTGHGVGINIHEHPRIWKDMDFILSENNIITIEPGIYFENDYGFRLESTVIVKDNGCDILTHDNIDIVKVK